MQLRLLNVTNNTKGFVRFSLLTLLLVSMCAGSALGCWFHHPTWGLERRIALAHPQYENFNHGHTPVLAFSHKGDKLLYLHSDNREVASRIYDIDSGKIVAESALPPDVAAHPNMMIQAAFSASNGDIVYASKYMCLQDEPMQLNPGGLDDELTWLNPQSFPRDERIFGPRRVAGPIADPHDPLFDLGEWGKRLSPHGVYFLSDGHCQIQVSRMGSFAPNGTEYAVAERSQKTAIYATSTGLQIDSIEDAGKYMLAARYSYDGRLLAILSQNEISIWRRLRDPGTVGFLMMPILWVGIIASFFLLFIFIRNMAKYRSSVPRLVPT